MARFLAVIVAVTAVVVGTVAPLEVTTASASVHTSSTYAKSSGDPAQSGIAKSTLVGFNAGNIISDAVFTNKNTMTEAQIQSFFNSKVSKCVVGKDENGKPYVCLKDFKITSVNMPADSYCSGYKGAANESAARIIYKVSQACNINPQVLIVMLQKEQGLVNHVWPSAWRYDKALGQGCPDTAPCDPAFVGFFHQIYGAGRQMQMYMEGRWFTWYAPGKTWGILYHPNANCGRGNVHIANKATSALYYYTPYQPNAAAMKAGYGEGDSCSSYGNRNFYNYFTDWFGSTQSAPTAPPGPAPVLTDINSTSYVIAADAKGSLLAYPYSKSVWGKTVTLASGLGNLTGAFSVGDLNGDGRRDFIVVGADGKPKVLYGGAKTSVGKPSALAGDWSGVTAVLPAGDFNGDGVEDIFTVDAKGNLYLRAGNALGGFAAASSVGTGWNKVDQIISGIDLDGDGKPDLVARDSNGNIKLFPGNGRSGWGTTVQIGTRWAGMTSIFSPGDFTGDGHADIMAHAADGDLLLYKGSKGGKLEAAGAVGNKWQTLVTKSAAGYSVKPLPAFPAGVGNLDGAGGTDIVAVASDGVAYIYGGDGRGGWTGRTKLGTGWSKKDKIVPLGDFDRSGSRDFGRIDSSGRFLMYSGSSGKATQIGKGWVSFTHVFGGMDFDGDRRLDVIGITPDGMMYLYRGDGKGGWLNTKGQKIGSGWTGLQSVFYMGDFNGDGIGDVVARFSDGTLRLYPMTGYGGWGTRKQIGTGWFGYPVIFSPGDFNGDGKNDVLAVGPKGVLYLYPSNGRGGWGARSQVGTGWSSMSPIG
ncbi:VCBS repeat-containing protein [Microbacterium paludicola]|uniref:FG-GAP repeat domain-containing protein n=1 Tax=Microbacterium paludicola TaxID=300019 RepID=UPI0011A3C676|nr:VCBS repeat-containing protein [Microbacterium paludicola]